MSLLLLIRHGLAEDFHPGQVDADRALTQAGWEKTRAAMRGVLGHGYAPSRGFHSPYRRAAETMVCLQEAAGAFPMESSLSLLPSARPAQVDLWLRGLLAEATPDTVLALISHQPLLSDLIFQLTGRSVDMKKASCTVIRWEHGCWGFERHLSPVELRNQA